jgi:hypothetical protein
MVDWTQVLIAAITTLGPVLSAYFASRANKHAKSAAKAADRAEVASLHPPPE